MVMENVLIVISFKGNFLITKVQEREDFIYCEDNEFPQIPATELCEHQGFQDCRLVGSTCN
jgi:hypothetical protein